VKIKVALTTLLAVCLLFPTPLATASFHEEFFEKIDPQKLKNDLETSIEKTRSVLEEIVSPEEITEYLKKGKNIPLDKIDEYFDTYYKNNASHFGDMENHLLTMAYDQSPQKYSEILSQNSVLKKKEVELLREKIQNLKTEQEDIWGKYPSDALSTIEIDGRRLIIATLSGQEDVDELSKRGDLVDEGTIILLKALPVYDPDERRISTLNAMATKLVAKIPALEGNDLQKDPVRTVSLVMLETDYLFYAKIILTEDERWISIDEAVTQGYGGEDTKNAKLLLTAAKTALTVAGKNPKELDRNLIEFIGIVLEVSEYDEKIPKWVMTNARWWIENEISREDYINGIHYLIEKRIIEY
jgi:polyhydroxyalkanoate synthesis regulator phasin